MRDSSWATALFRAALCVTLLVITFLAITPQPQQYGLHIGDKLNHWFAFYVLALLADFSFPKDGLAASKIALLLTYGLALETIQHNLPNREFSSLDFVANLAGVLTYYASVPLLKQLPMSRYRWRES
ncbi:MAG: VanZ family protein [Gammaproteobacteria bacterium]